MGIAQKRIVFWSVLCCLLAGCLGFLFFQNCAPRAAVGAARSSELHISHVSVRYVAPDMAESQIDSFEDPETIGAISAFYNTVNLRFDRHTNIIPLGDMRFDLTVSDGDKTYATLSLPGNGYAYADGKRYAIDPAAERTIFDYLETKR